MGIRKIQFILSLLFLIGYLVLIVIVLTVEVSDSFNMHKGENSLIGEINILLGVLTGAVAQILNFWFNEPDK
ncbi:MAG TPA: hypothetical protein DDE71_09785 [Tenacibaculum sp.]|nr:hypothetical protein [Tenacibaculum sp.]